MLAFVGQNLMFGKEALNPYQTNITQINHTTIRNATFDHFNATRDVTSAYSKTLPTTWDVNTIMDCNFDSLNAGNLNTIMSNVNKILVKRQRIDIEGQPWITVYEVPILLQTELSFVVNDFTAINNAKYQYMLVPVYVEEDIEKEGLGNVSDAVLSTFDGVLICSQDNFYKLYAGVNYGDTTTVQLTGVHQTLGSKYPIVVINSNVGYETGSLSGTVLNEDYGEFSEVGYIGLDRKKIVEAQEKLKGFMNDGMPKIIKDWNGNAWLVIFTSDINTSYYNQWGMGLADMSASWTEIGDVEDETDLRGAGFVGGV